MQADPIGLNGGWDVYRYASNRPTVEVDPTGLQGSWPISFRHPQKSIDAAFGFAYAVGLADGPADALAHCVGACQLSSDFGRTIAELLLDHYELETAREGKQLRGDMDMDLENNTAGIDIGAECDPDCALDCYTAFKNDQLATEGFNEGPSIGYWSTWSTLTRRLIGRGLGQ